MKIKSPVSLAVTFAASLVLLSACAGGGAGSSPVSAAKVGGLKAENPTDHKVNECPQIIAHFVAASKVKSTIDIKIGGYVNGVTYNDGDGPIWVIDGERHELGGVPSLSYTGTCLNQTLTIDNFVNGVFVRKVTVGMGNEGRFNRTTKFVDSSFGKDKQEKFMSEDDYQGWLEASDDQQLPVAKAPTTTSTAK